MQGLVKLFSLQFFRDPAAPCAQPLPGRQELLTLQLEAPLRYCHRIGYFCWLPV